MDLTTLQIMRMVREVVNNIPPQIVLPDDDPKKIQLEKESLRRLVKMAEIEYEALKKYFINKEIESCFVRCLLNKLTSEEFRKIIVFGPPETFEDFQSHLESRFGFLLNY